MPSSSRSSSDSALNAFKSTESVGGRLGRDGFTIGDKIAEGSFGTVYKATFNETAVAVKVVDLTKITKNSNRLSHFKNELEALNKLKHPHIVKLIRHYQQGSSKAFMFLELAEKDSIIDMMLNVDKPIDEKSARKWSRQLALAMKYIHAQNYCHHDLKADNVLVNKFDNLKLCDFGHSERTKDDRGNDILSQNYCGSVPYLPPEVFLKRPYSGILFDIWSYGVLIFVMLHNSFPFDDHDHSKMYKNMTAERYELTMGSTEAHDIIKRILKPARNRPSFDQILTHPWLRA